ncbi:hypothetical protein IWW39_003501 [Coemansia spiralis]|uniref:protein-tyrosine-phosphatase n=1 Tax=Coemansia spiralis TaxID=417178 RepID=A0A9W8GL30_9FUNG|nr:hypothetical protein IWW39_003501 [Coemansia spiralis]
MKATNRPLTRASTAPPPLTTSPLSLPLRRLSTRKATAAPFAAGLPMNLSMDGLRTIPNNAHPRSAALVNAGARPRLPSMTMDSLAPLAGPLVPGQGAEDVAMARRAARTYRLGPQLIMPYLYLGGAGNVADEQLRALEITHVLNVAREVSGPLPAGIASRHCMWDHDEPDLERYFAECFAFIDQARFAQRGVLVHCQMGVSRSASLVIAYVMRTMAMGFTPAYEYVRLRAPCISPNLSLIAQLAEYGERLVGAGCFVPPPPPELLLLMPDATLPELTADESSAAGSENSSPMESLDDGSAVTDKTAAEVDLLNMPIKQLLVLPPVPATGGGGGVGTVRQTPQRLHVVAHRHFLVP